MGEPHKKIKNRVTSHFNASIFPKTVSTHINLMLNADQVEDYFKWSEYRSIPSSFIPRTQEPWKNK